MPLNLTRLLLVALSGLRASRLGLRRRWWLLLSLVLVLEAFELVELILEVAQLAHELGLRVAHHRVGVIEALLDLVAHLVEARAQEHGDGAEVHEEVVLDEVVHLADGLLDVVELVAAGVEAFEA